MGGTTKGPVYGRQRREVSATADTEHAKRLAAYEREVADLQEQAKALEEEIITLRRRLQDAPKRVRTLEEKLLETKGQLAQAVSQNEKLTYTLREAREHIAALREEVEKLTQPPSAYGTFLAANDDGTVDVFSGGRKMRVSLHPELETEALERGQEVVLNEALNVVLARGPEMSGTSSRMSSSTSGRGSFSSSRPVRGSMRTLSPDRSFSPRRSAASSATRSSSARPTITARVPSSRTSFRVTTSPLTSRPRASTTFSDSLRTTSLPRTSSSASISGWRATRILRPPENTSTVSSSLRARNVP